MTKVNPENLKRGDILLVHREKGAQHTAIYCGGGQLVHASINEKGGIKGGKTGDQTGREICVRSYYDKPWDYVLRYPDAVLADEYTKKAEAIAADDAHGYDQINRNGPDFDCSSLVCHVVESVGIPVRQNGASYTGNMKAAFVKCGFKIIDTTQKTTEAPTKPPSTSDGKIYIVQKGDTLGAIARRFKTSIGALMDANKQIKDANKIYIGQKLTIPTKTAPTVYSGTVKTQFGGPLNIRAGQGTSYRIVGQLANGSAVKLSTITGEWFKLADREGYVSARYIRIG